jgi:Carboxypeptidase regulatory-like domain
MVRKYFFAGIKNGALFASVALILLVAVEAQGQTTGTIYGRVNDSSGATITAATVTVRNLETDYTRTAVTDAEGAYSFTLLSVGKYSITVEAKGFRPYEQKGLELQVAANLRVDIRLEVGQLTEGVNVTGEAPQVDTASATLGKVVEERRIVELPLNGRNFLQLGVLQTGVVPPIPGINSLGSGTNSTPGGTAFNFSVNGMRITSNNHLLDGANNVEPFSGAAMIVPSPDALQEFRILTNSYSAEFGRAGGSIVTVLSKSGTNSYHGSVYEFLRNEIFDARNFFAPQVPALKQNQFGATFGGRIIKNKTFFFGSYEGFRQRRGVPTSTPVPSLLVRQGDFSQEAVKPIDPLTGQPFPGGIIPQDRIDAVARNVLKLYPEPNLGSNIWTGAPSAVNDRNQFMVRGDHTFIEDKNTLTGRYLFDQGLLLSPGGQAILNIGAVNVPGFSLESPNRFQNLILADTHVFSQRVINDFRFSYQRANVTNERPVDPQDPSSLGFTYPIVSPLRATPGIAVSGYTALGYNFFNDRLSNFYEFVDTIAVSAGKHNLKFGGDIRRTQVSGLFSSIVFGSFGFTGAVTRNPLGDLLLGRPLTVLQAGGKADKKIHQTAYYFYGQDELRLRQNLTLNLGLRYELVPGFTDPDRLEMTFVPGVQSVLSPTLPRGILRPGDPGIPDNLIRTGKRNFAPRIGIAWDPFGDGKTSIRAGYGLFYDDSSLVQIFTVQQPPDFQPIIVTILPSSFADPYLGKSPFTPPLNFPLNFPPGFTVTWTAHDYKLPYIQHWNLTLQRQLTSSLAVEIAYVGNKGTRLQGTVDPNQPIWAPGATSGNAASRRPYPLIGNVLEITSRFNSNYHGLQTTVTQRFNHGLSFQASYTWSKAIDDTTLPTGFFTVPGQPTRPQNSRNLEAERGLSAFDVRHRFVLSYLYELPFYKQSTSGAASYLLGGWKLSGIVALQSGYPFTVIDTRDPSVDTVADNDRTDVLRNPNLPSDQRTPNRWFDTSAFVRFSPPNFGNAGRNILFTDGIVNFDLGLAKDFKFGEERKLEFRWEIFNVFNHPNFGVPVNDLNSPSFGRVLRTMTSERQMQFGLKFLF